MAIPDTPITRAETFLAKAAGQEVTLPEPITREEHYLKAIAENAVLTTPQDFTTAQKIQALKNLDGIRVVMLDSGTITLAELAEMIADINEDGEHVFFDVAALSYPLYLCTVAINYDDGSPVSYRLNDLVTGSVSMGSYDGTKTLSTILAEAVNGFYSITVTAVTQDSVTVTGQTVTVRSTDASGAVYATATYNGQPVSFSVPNGFVYYVSITSTLAGHFKPTTASGIINGADVAVTLTYSDFHTIQRFSDVKAALNEDIDLTDLVGQQVYMLKDNQQITFDVVDYDETTKEVTLLSHDCYKNEMQFEPGQASTYLENGLAAGDYSFIKNTNNKTYYFTITTAIPPDGQLRLTDARFETYESQLAKTILETGTLSENEIAGAVSLGRTASGSLNHPNRSNYGSSNYAESWIRMWLNSDFGAGDVVTPITLLSRAYNSAVKGFLNGIDQSDLDCIENAEWKCATNNDYECPEEYGGITSKGTAYVVVDRFALASEKEIFGTYSGVDDGSSVFDLYADASAVDRIKMYWNSAKKWCLRSPNGVNNFITVNAQGEKGIDGAFVTTGIAPCCKIRKTTQGG